MLYTSTLCFSISFYSAQIPYRQLGLSFFFPYWLYVLILYKVAQHRRRQEAALAAQRKEAADRALIRTGMVKADRFAPAGTSPSPASLKKSASRSPGANSSGSSDRKKKVKHSSSQSSRRLFNQNRGDDNDDDDGAAVAVAIAASLEIEDDSRAGRSRNGAEEVGLDLDDDACSLEAGGGAPEGASAAADAAAAAADEDEVEKATGMVQQAPRSAFAPHELLPACCRWAPDSAGRYFSGLLSALTIFAGSGPPTPLFLLGAAFLALYYNGRSGNSSSSDENGNPLPGVRCQPSLWFLPPLGVALMCAAVAGVMLRAALMVFLPWWEHTRRQRYGSQLDYLRRRTQLLRFFATSKHCVMCLAQPASALAQPCGHLALCHACATPFRRSRPLPRCVVCREPCTYTKVVRSRRASGEAVTEESWYRRAVDTRDSKLDPVNYEKEPLVELRRQV